MYIYNTILTHSVYDNLMFYVSIRTAYFDVNNTWMGILTEENNYKHASEFKFNSNK